VTEQATYTVETAAAEFRRATAGKVDLLPAAQLRDETMALAGKLAELDGAALRATKEAFKQVTDMTYEQAYWWLMAKSNELRWRHDQEGTDYQGIDKFLSKQYRPAVGSYTQAKERDG